MARYFTATEVENLNPRLVILMDQMRDLAEIPMIVTCGYRTPEHNAEVGGVPDSEHTHGLAVDIRCNDSISRYKFLSAALKVGFKRIEIGTKHLHLGISETAPQNVCWLGESH